jgi:rod shape-determining protein MreC
VVNDEPVRAGEMILTSGEDRIFPKDLLIGTVSMANQGNPFQVIHVRPAARLDRLEDVLILLTPQELKRPNESADASTTPGIVQKEAPPSSPAPAGGNTSTPNRAHVPAPATSPATQPPASATPAPQD